MRRLALFVSLLAVACTEAGTRSGPLSQADSAAIRATLSALTTAGTTGHHRELGRFFTEDGVWMAPGQAAVQGRSRVQAWFTIAAKEWQHQIVELEGVGDLAYARGSYSLNLDLPKFVPVNGKVLAVLRRQPDGSWLIARYAFSCDTAC